MRKRQRKQLQIGLAVVITIVGISCSNQSEPPASTEEMKPLSLSLATPKRVSLQGNEFIKLTGSGFQEGAQVFFADQVSTTVKFNSSQELEVLVPKNQNAFGATSIKVVNPDGTTIINDKIFYYFTKTVTFLESDANRGLIELKVFAAEKFFKRYAYNALVADFDNDGKLDIAVSGQGTLPNPTSTRASACTVNECFVGLWKVLFGNGFSSESFFDKAMGVNPIAMTVADADQDKQVEPIFVQRGVEVDGERTNDSVLVTKMDKDTKHLFSMNKDSMGRPQLFALDFSPSHIVAGQFQTKGVWDLVSIGQKSDNTNHLYLQAGLTKGKLSQTKDISLPGKPVVSLAADMNQDGLDDLIVADESGTLSFFMGQSGQLFASPKTQAIGKTPSSLAAADLNEDGLLDIAVSDRENHTVSIFWQSQNGSFDSSFVKFTSEQRPIALTTGDINGDGLADIVVAFRSVGDKPNDKNVVNQILILVNQGNKTFAQVIAPYQLDGSVKWSQANPILPAQPQAVVVFNLKQATRPGLAVVDPRGYLVTLPNRSY